jgi:hypothetical protein
LNTWAWWTAPGSHVPICIDETWEISSSGSCYVGGAIAILKNIREGLSHILWKNMFETTSHMIFESHTEVERITNHLLKCTYQVSSPGGIIFVLRSTQWISHFWQVMNSMGLEVVRIIKPLGNPPLDNCKFCMSSSLLHLHFLYPPVFFDQDRYGNTLKSKFFGYPMMVYLRVSSSSSSLIPIIYITIWLFNIAMV